MPAKAPGFPSHLWRLFYVHGTPGELCGGETEYSPDEILSRIAEECPGQKEHLYRNIFFPYDRQPQVGEWAKGRRFLVVCSR